MKRVLITGGSTNEPVDEVMRLITMGTGSLSVKLGKLFHDAGWDVTMILNILVNDSTLPKDEHIRIEWVETTQEMMDALHKESETCHYDAVIHSSAVNDYKPEFEFLMEDMAEEIFEALPDIKSAEDILAILTDPKCRLRNDTKISSYQSNLTIKLGLTPKIISNLRGWFPDTKIFGFKLLENVSEEELLEVATKLYANDVARLFHPPGIVLHAGRVLYISIVHHPIFRVEHDDRNGIVSLHHLRHKQQIRHLVVLIQGFHSLCPHLHLVAFLCLEVTHQIVRGYQRSSSHQDSHHHQPEFHPSSLIRPLHFSLF